MTQEQFRLELQNAIQQCLDGIQMQNQVTSAAMEDAINKYLVTLKDKVLQEFIAAASQPPVAEEQLSRTAPLVKTVPSVPSLRTLLTVNESGLLDIVLTSLLILILPLWLQILLPTLVTRNHLIIILHSGSIQTRLRIISKIGGD